MRFDSIALHPNPTVTNMITPANTQIYICNSEYIISNVFINILIYKTERLRFYICLFFHEIPINVEMHNIVTEEL